MSAQSDEGRPPAVQVQSRGQPVLIACRDGAGQAELHERLRRHADVAVARLLPERQGGGAIAVVRLPADHPLWRQAAEAGLLIEPDSPLMAATPRRLPLAPMASPASGAGFAATIEVRGDHGQSLEGALVQLSGGVWEAQAVTGADGTAPLTLAGETPETLLELAVLPRHGHWSRWMAEPLLAADSVNTITLKPLSDQVPGFPAQATTGWGARAMGLDRLPGAWRGQGIRVAVIDSGVAASHPQLSGIQHGRDFTGPDPRGWARDALGHGTAVAGLLAAAGDTGIRGCIPDAEIHVCKVFPGGRCGDLIAALDYCLDQDIDIAILGLGTDWESDLVEQRIRLAKQHGIAIIAAAGSSGGAVQYPARSANVLAVAAIGKAGEYPADSCNASWGDGEEGFFVPEFSCAGPGIDVCAPGVAILSCQAPDGYAAWDGTSLAAPHVAALAAHLLAQHPALRQAGRDGRRVDSLFGILKDTALAAGDANVVGAGLPDAGRATGQDTGSAPADVANALRRIITILRPSPEAAPGLDQLHAAMRAAGLDRPEEIAAGTTPGLYHLRMTMVMAGLSPPH